MSDKSRKRMSGEALPVSQILSAVGKNIHLDRKVQEWTVLALWDRVIDPPFQGKTRATRLKRSRQQNELVVQASHAVVAADLTFFLEEYRIRLNAFAPQTGLEIHRIRIDKTHC